MPEDKDFQVKVQRIGELVGELENIADPESRASAKTLVQLLLDLHAVGLERALEIVAKNGESGQRIIDDLAGIRWLAVSWCFMVFTRSISKDESRRRWRKFSRECAKAEANWSCSASKAEASGCRFKLPDTPAVPPARL